MLMVTYIKVSGSKAKQTAMVFLQIRMEVCMKGSGSTTSSTAKAKKVGIIIRLNILGTSWKEKNQEREGLNFKVGFMMENFLMANSKEQENTILQILVKCMKGSF